MNDKISAHMALVDEYFRIGGTELPKRIIASALALQAEQAEPLDALAGWTEHKTVQTPYGPATSYKPCFHQEPAPGYCKHCKEYTIEAPLTAPAQQPEGFDVWMNNPYTKVLQKSIAEDYVPKPAQQPLSDEQKQHIHDVTGAGHSLICLVESYILAAQKGTT